MNDQPQSIVEHLSELRNRIVRSLLVIIVAIGVSVAFADRAFKYILSTASTPEHPVAVVQMNFSDSFMAEFRLAIIAGIVIAFPFVLYQVVAFILPALHPNERRLLYFGLPFATVLFFAGWAFGWFVVVPISKGFFLDLATGLSVTPQITPSAYMSFILGICNPLGIAFELPLVVLILARIGLVSAGFLARIRKFAFLGIMIIAAVLSPPDVVSMAIFLVPLYGLYEFSILLARVAGKKK
ncbi:MAG TPA: twin-arginine translocase subunit TatC [Symbiobacteriaceae bacterium]|nr:twin-arginine translocase subunit TatC [Symbiobacteriaceae bacterium]